MGNSCTKHGVSVNNYSICISGVSKSVSQLPQSGVVSLPTSPLAVADPAASRPSPSKISVTDRQRREQLTHLPNAVRNSAAQMHARSAAAGRPEYSSPDDGHDNEDRRHRSSVGRRTAAAA